MSEDEIKALAQHLGLDPKKLTIRESASKQDFLNKRKCCDWNIKQTRSSTTIILS